MKYFQGKCYFDLSFLITADKLGYSHSKDLWAKYYIGDKYGLGLTFNWRYFFGIGIFNHEGKIDKNWVGFWIVILGLQVFANARY